MPILNYTTEIKADRTIGEIQGVLARAGARSIIVDYQDGEPEAVTFVLELNGNWFNFRLPANVKGVLNKLMDTKIPNKFKTAAHARRVAWRIIKDWVESQMALIEAEQAEISEVFLPYLVSPQTGRTLFQEFKSGNFLLPPGDK